MSADVVAFLHARLSEDEAVASRSVSEHSVMGDDQSSGLYYDYWERQDLDLGITAARVLRQVEAGRVALGWYVDDDSTVMEATIRALAAIYRDHEDYREEWAS